MKYLFMLTDIPIANTVQVVGPKNKFVKQFTYLGGIIAYNHNKNQHVLECVFEIAKPIKTID